MSHFTMNFNVKENDGKKSFSSISIVYPIEKNMIIGSITIRMEIIMGIQVFLFHEITLIITKMIEKKAFLPNPKHQYCVSQ